MRAVFATLLNATRTGRQCSLRTAGSRCQAVRVSRSGAKAVVLPHRHSVLGPLGVRARAENVDSEHGIGSHLEVTRAGVASIAAT